MSEYVVPLVVAICTNELQLAPEQRSMRYPVTPGLPVEALQVKVVCVLDVATAARFTGAVAGVAGGSGGAEFEEPGRLVVAVQPARISTGRTAAK